MGGIGPFEGTTAVALMGKDRTLFHLFGLPIKANISWLFLVALVVFTLATGFFPQQLGGRYSVGVYWGLALAGAFLLFASLIAHEMCHSLVARATGMPVAGITLFIFGGVSQLEDEPPTAGTEFIMAVVGPLSSVVIGVGFLGLLLLGQSLGWPKPLIALFLYLTIINFMLAAFNSIPAFPLDGGRVLRSAVWGITGDLKRATQVAVTIGSVFGLGLIMLGVFAFFWDRPISGIWLIVIGFFVRQAAAGSLQMVVLREQLSGDTVSRFMTSPVVSVPADLSVADFVERYVFHYRHAYYPVVDGTGQLVGLLSARKPRELDSAQWTAARVGDLMIPIDESMVVEPDADAVDAMASLRNREEHRLVVVHDRRPVGIITLRDLLGFLALKIDLAPRR
jgi:Zn-dependent protease/predicted transcriptional regulator